MAPHLIDVTLNADKGILLRAATVSLGCGVESKLRGNIHRGEKIARGKRWKGWNRVGMRLCEENSRLLVQTESSVEVEMNAMDVSVAHERNCRKRGMDDVHQQNLFEGRCECGHGDVVVESSTEDDG
jgi:hypothetical protein